MSRCFTRFFRPSTHHVGTLYEPVHGAKGISPSLDSMEAARDNEQSGNLRREFRVRGMHVVFALFGFLRVRAFAVRIPIVDAWKALKGAVCFSDDATAKCWSLDRTTG